MKLSFAPSGWDRWSVCSASPAAVAGVKTERKSYSDEGNIAHELQAHCLMWEISPRSLIGQTINVKDIGESLITAEMAEYIDDVIHYIEDQTAGFPHRLIEHKVSLDHLIPGQKGFADFIALNDKCTEMHIIDLKYGEGVKVFAKNNGELMLHASGVARSLSPEQQKKLKKIHIHIAQVRLEHFDKWAFTAAELVAFETTVVEKYEKAKNEDTREFVPSVDGCRFCAIKNDCRSLKESIYAKAFDPETKELIDPARLNHTELAEMFEWYDFISAWANNAKAHMVELAEQGVQFPGLKMISGKAGARNWVTEEVAIRWMTDKGFADFEMYEQSLISPAKAEAQIGKKNVGEEFKKGKTIVVQRDGKPRLVKDSHASPSVTESKINDFNDV